MIKQKLQIVQHPSFLISVQRWVITSLISYN